MQADSSGELTCVLKAYTGQSERPCISKHSYLFHPDEDLPAIISLKVMIGAFQFGNLIRSILIFLLFHLSKYGNTFSASTVLPFTAKTPDL